MKLTLASDTALEIMRALRPHWKRPPERGDLHDPDPSPRKRWSARLIDLERFGIEGPSEDRPVFICMGDRDARLRTKGVRNVVHAGELPQGAFVDLGGGIYASGPELVFVEYASDHTLAETCLLGMELCGRFSRDAKDPLDGHATMEIDPVTSCEKIERFLAGCRSVKGLVPARKALRFIADDAWSPMEAIVAVMMMLPLEEYGYGLGHCSLNVRVPTPNKVRDAAAKETRAPDILVDGTKVGVNYDGYVHLDLGQVVDAAVELGRNPGSAQAERIVRWAADEVRAKAVEDLRRNRDLVAAGYDVFPVVKEDLYQRGALDGVMWQLVGKLEKRSRKRYPQLKIALENSFAVEERYRLLRSMAPGQASAPKGELATSDVFIRLDSRP